MEKSTSRNRTHARTSKRLTCVLQELLTPHTNLFNHKSNHYPYTVTHAFNQPGTRRIHSLENMKWCRQALNKEKKKVFEIKIFI